LNWAGAYVLQDVRDLLDAAGGNLYVIVEVDQWKGVHELTFREEPIDRYECIWPEPEWHDPESDVIDYILDVYGTPTLEGTYVHIPLLEGARHTGVYIDWYTPRRMPPT
jgi:hypothetical protein